MIRVLAWTDSGENSFFGFQMAPSLCPHMISSLFITHANKEEEIQKESESSHVSSYKGTNLIMKPHSHNSIYI